MLDKEKNVNIVMKITNCILKGKNKILYHYSEREV